MIVFTVAVFVAIGLFVAFTSDEVYTASSTFIPQTSEPSAAGSSLGGLAALAGLNLGAGASTGDIPTNLYPKITSSVRFRLLLMRSDIRPPGFDRDITYAEYYDSESKPSILGVVRMYTLGLPSMILDALRGQPENHNIINTDSLNVFRRLSFNELRHYERIGSQMQIVPDVRDGFVSIYFSMDDPYLAAQMAKKVEALLQNEILGFRRQSAKEQLNFIEGRFNLKKTEFEDIRERLSTFLDRNQNISSAVARNQQQSLQSNYDFAFQIYTELATQLEKARLQVNKDTPVFTVIDEVTVPSMRSSPKRIMIIITYTLLGFILGVGLVFFKLFYSEAKQFLNDKF